MTVATLAKKTSGPRSKKSQSFSKRLRPVLRSLARPRVLCVDDDPDFHTSLQIHLERYRVDIDQAFHGMQGFKEAIRNPPDLILMDLIMPNGSGQYLVDTIKKNEATCSIPIIVATGLRDAGLKKQMLLQGVSSFLLKPIRSDEIIREIARFIDIRLS